MSTEPVRAGSGWLALREPADATARSEELVDALRPHLPTPGIVVHDLGCGTGSQLRWLAPRLAGPQRWVLHDRDTDLLDLAAAGAPVAAADGARVTVETRRGDVTGLPASELAGASLVTASALLDMLTAAELGRLVAVCVAAGCPVLVTLSVVGRVELRPADPLDAEVAAAFDADQRRQTAAGRLLGPDACAVAVDAFTRAGHEVLVRPSPWHLGPDQRELVTAWFTGWLDAACARRPDLRPTLSPAVATYRRQRLAGAASGSLGVTVHHRDLLALPAARPSTS
ncbi:methyltransferase domain-containing protein [Nocardioides guangzhouensis]|uniref:Methyltransferase domain-containing protein n=1 Tax=Nocardioides guangzhouensis TaxID=2497878 RepID=A0A4V1Y008_9ACTN|nr:methyltransferase domain-containing protein [Nocardioides guangzhouensis]RYP88599.1 methyltransferase domain-containing protein [Nocardioides guangzhouensis]